MTRPPARVFIALCLFVATLAVRAQAQPIDREEFLVPLSPGAVHGALGSIWVTDLAIANAGDEPVTVWGFMPTCVTLCNSTPPPIPARKTVFLTTQLSCGNGALLSTDKLRADSLFFTLRSRDVTRESQRWGAIVPVVGSQDQFSGRFSIVDVPLGTRFRSHLRLICRQSESKRATFR